MQRKPIISVTIATYNRSHLLPRAINSVLNQTYQNFELIIVDDCSTDNTKDIIKSFTDNRIIYHRHKKNKGLLAAVNTGWDLSKGKYQCKLDDDDELLPNALEIVVTKFNELSVKGIKFLWFDCINAETGELGGFGLKEEGYITYERLLRGNPGDYWQVVDRELLGEIRYDERWWGGSGIIWLKLLRKSRAYYIPKVLYKAYREHGKRMATNTVSSLQHLPGIILLETALLDEHGKQLKRLFPRLYGQRLSKLGFHQILNGKIIKGRKTLLTSFKFNFSLRCCFLFLLSFIVSPNQIKAIYIKFSILNNK